MAERIVGTEGFFARGIDAITHRERPGQQDLPAISALQRLAPPAHQHQSVLERLLAGYALDAHIDAMILPAVPEPDLLLPRLFNRALEDARRTVQRASERHGRPEVLERAAKILAEEQEWRELARTFREALYQA